MPFDHSKLHPLPPGADRRVLLDVSDDRGCLLLCNPAQGVIVTRAGGHMSAAMGEQWIAVTARVWTQAPKVFVFNEWERMDTYDSAARRQLTDWVIAHRAQMDSAWFLTASRIVAMGVAAAGAATALVGVGMFASRDRASWEQALRQRIAR